MAVTRWQESAFAPWAALLASFVASGLHQQFLADVLRYDCRAGTATMGVVAGLVSIAVIALGCWVSWAATHGQPFVRSTDATRRFVARLGMLFAALASIAIVWQVLATFLVSACPD
jgi:glutathione S-transferase